MTGNFCGGIAGEIGTVTRAEITNCTNTGNINDVDTVPADYTHNAGILAKQSGGVYITGCKNSGNVKSINTAAGIIAQNQGIITITNCINSGAITATTSERVWHGTGGFVAYTNSKVTLTNCINTGAITAKGYAGGAIGSCDQTTATLFTFNGFINDGDIKSESYFAGGAVGNTVVDVSITNSVNSGDVTGAAAVGGFIGKTTANVTVDNSVNSGSIKGTAAVGGFVGEFATAGKTATITNGAMNKGNVEATDGHAGGAIGKADLMSGTINVSDFFNSGNVTSTSSAGGVLGRAEPGKENDVEKDNSALKITIDRLVNTGTIIGKWRGCAATGYIQKSTVTINNSISTGKTQYYGNTNPKYYANSFAFADNGNNSGNVTGSGNYYVNGNALGEDFGETKGTISDILDILNAENSPYVHGPYASNYNGGTPNNIVLATPEFEGYQTGTTVTDGKAKIRLLATIDDVNLVKGSCEYTYLGFKITVDGAEADYTGVQYVYESIKATNGSTPVTYTATEFGGKYIYAEVLELDATKAHTIKVQTFASNVNTDNPQETDLYYGAEYVISIPVMAAN